PHALATAAGLPDRIIAVASVASIAPPDRTHLDITEGMGEGSIVEFGLAQQGEAALRPALERDSAELGTLDVPAFVEGMRPVLYHLVGAPLVRERGGD